MEDGPLSHYIPLYQMQQVFLRTRDSIVTNSNYFNIYFACQMKYLETAFHLENRLRLLHRLRGRVEDRQINAMLEVS